VLKLMARKLLSILGTLAMLFAFLPGLVAADADSQPMDCCNGVMCPLHAMMAAHIICDLASMPRDGMLQSCPNQATHYSVMLQFLRVAPSVFFAQRLVQPAFLPGTPLKAKVEVEVPFPPPRTVPA
jgi:hypothetical protein